MPPQPDRFYTVPLGDLVPNFTPPPRPPHVALRGKFVTVEPCDPDAHAAPLVEAYGDEQARLFHFIGYGPFANADAYRDFLKKLVITAGSHTQLYVVRDNATGKLVGFGTYLRIDPESASIEIGHIVLSPQLQRTKGATEFFHLLVDNAFAMGYRRVEWKCNWRNKPSVNAALRLGFSFEGVFRQARVEKGRNRDTAWFAVMDWEWPRVKAAHRQWMYSGGDAEQTVRLSDLTKPLLAPMAHL